MITNSSTPPRILGICASLRAGRWGGGAADLVDQIHDLATEEDLGAFLERESLAHLENFVQAGRDEGRPFDELYKNLKKTFGRTGLSNSEVGITAALWSAKQLGCEIDFVSLCDHFPPSGVPRDLDGLKTHLRNASGILLGTPVYFGDRSSLAHDFLRLIQEDVELQAALAGRVYAGVAVGAKRNGGQETTLVYQILDMVNAGLLAVGNDSETTSQYGGTLHAGDVGTAWKDDYGLTTSKGTGRRIARVANQLQLADRATLRSKLRIAFWILQDRDGYALEQVKKLIEPDLDRIEPIIIDASEGDITRCLACDICPTHVGVDAEYRCIIKKKTDFFMQSHSDLLDMDALVPVGVTSRSQQGIVSRYQQFIERTRYLRRGDYVFTDLVMAPLLFDELGANDSLQIRMLTSSIRHHTVLARPIVGYLHDGRLLNPTEMTADWQSFVKHAGRVTVGRLVHAQDDETVARYNPVGYILSAEKDKEDIKLERRREATADRAQRAKEMAERRLTPISVTVPR